MSKISCRKDDGAREFRRGGNAPGGARTLWVRSNEKPPHRRGAWATFYAFAITVFGFSSSCAAAEFVPESGIYYNPSQVGTGYVFETQDDTFTFSIFSYEGVGRAEYYVSSGKISTGLQGTLFRVAGGIPLGSTRISETGQGLTSTPVGAVALRSTFETADSFYGSLVLDLTLTSPPTGEPTTNTFVLTRMNFGYGGIGSAGKQSCWNDMSGDWVFVDKVSRATWRYHFTQVTTQPAQIACSNNSDVNVVSFRDVAAAVTLRCVRSLQTVDPIDGLLKFSGCELRADTQPQPLFSFDVFDIGVKQMLGSSGRLSTVGSGEQRRRSGNILGIRIE